MAKNLSNFICYICKKPVLGLKGQDVILDTYLLNDSLESKAVLQSENYGRVHLTCLSQDSHYWDFWRSRLHENFVTRGYTVWSEQILVNKNAKELVIFEPNRWFSVRNTEIVSLDQATQKIQVRHEVNLILSNLSKKETDQISDHLHKPSGYQLNDLIARLELEPVILHRDELVSARISPLEDEAKETFRALKEGFLTATCTYCLSLSQESFSLLSTLI